MSNFWTDSNYFSGPPLDAGMVRRAEELLNYKLPEAYVKLLETRNGGTPLRDCFPTRTPTSWAVDHIAIAGILGIGGEWGIDSPTLGSAAMTQEWGYPEIGIVVAACPSAGHDVVMLDYSKCGRLGEPRIVHVDTTSGNPQITFLAPDFGSFVHGLVESDMFPDPV